MQKPVLAFLGAMVLLCSNTWAQSRIDPAAATFGKALSQVMNSRNADQGIALLSPDAALVDPFGKLSTGKQAERDFFELAFKLNPNATFAFKPVASHINGNTMWLLATAAWTPSGNTAGAKPVETHVAYVLVRQGKAWKVQMLSVGFNGQPPIGR